MKDRPVRIWTACIVVVCSLLASTMPALAHNHTSGIAQNSIYDQINDAPERWGAPWYRGASGKGYGDNNYSYTYVKGSANLRGTTIDTRSYARWIYDAVPAGDCTVSVFVPDERASASVQYDVYQGARRNLKTSALITQRHASGWTYLTDYRSEGGEVRIYLYNNDNPNVGRDLRVDNRGFDFNRIAADALRLECFPLSTSEAIRHVGNSASGTLSDYYSILFQRFLAASNNQHECNEIKADSDAPWITTTRIATTNAPLIDGRRHWTKGHAYDYTFPIGECTSWVHFRLRATTTPHFHNGYLHEAFGGTGTIWSHAHLWDRNAGASGVSLNMGSNLDYVPEQYSVAQWNNRPLGHVAFVEAVSADGDTIWVSEMNNGGRQVCYLQTRVITRSTNNGGVDSWPDFFIAF